MKKATTIGYRQARRLTLGVLLVTAVIFGVNHAWIASMMEDSTSATATLAVAVGSQSFTLQLQPSEGRQAKKADMVVGSVDRQQIAATTHHNKSNWYHTNSSNATIQFTSTGDFQMTMENGILARAFRPWPRHVPFPCFAPDAAMWSDEVQRSAVSDNRGLFFMKLLKTAGSTAAGIHLRLSKNMAARLLPDTKKQNGTWSWNRICKGRWEHSRAKKMKYGFRNRQESFLWTVLRDPTSRAVSQYFHFVVSRFHVSATDDKRFQRYLEKETRNLYNYYIQALSTDTVFGGDVDTMVSAINTILHVDYNFIGITERLDESAVVLKMLLNLSMADILYLNAKVQGRYDDGAYMDVCRLIPPSVVTPGMKAYFQSAGWRAVVRWDTELYHAANKSLDLTIDRLGRTAFDVELQFFRRALKMAQDRCMAREVFPCTSTGQWNNQSSCLWGDSACGNDCLDEVANELELW